MDTLYASIKHDIILAIERSAIAIYAKIDFRSADSFGLCLKKQIHIYRRLLSELNFRPISEQHGLMLFVHQDKNPLSLNLVTETLDEHISTLESHRV